MAIHHHVSEATEATRTCCPCWGYSLPHATRRAWRIDQLKAGGLLKSWDSYAMRFHASIHLPSMVCHMGWLGGGGIEDMRDTASMLQVAT